MPLSIDGKEKDGTMALKNGRNRESKIRHSFFPYPKTDGWLNQKRLVGMACLGIGLYALSLFFGTDAALTKEMRTASHLMEKALVSIRDCRLSRGIVVEETRDINRTGLIGRESSSITTSVGQLEAKRTTTNPNFAGLLVYLLSQAGVKKGDVIAVGASGSFPALLVATLCASRTLELEPVVFLSLGASQWGANLAEFHALDMWRCLGKSGIVTFKPAALSLGGVQDVGLDMLPEGRRILTEALETSGVPVFRDINLERNVAERMRLYVQSAGGRPIKAFVNIGGSWANLGTDSVILEVKPGLSRRVPLPPVERRGVIQAMAARGIPVIHCLFIRGLAAEFGLPWDPKPLPPAGRGALYRMPNGRGTVFIVPGIVYLLVVLLWIGLEFRSRKQVLIYS
ncbi:MAG: poly-gamma-glutamate system protein [Candidatus Aminicenantes bacterium]|nr:poly-gamma-glutamate system protein [Candidatus Aminicenantes bacterium]